jgi:hypothetical protein
MVGSVLTREYKGRTLRVTVLHNGFALDGEVYRSLSDGLTAGVLDSS